MSFFSLSIIWGLKDELLVFLLALRDSRTPLSGKLFALLSIVYLVSPIDIVTDILPFAGVLDDLILVPFGIWLSQQRIPKEVLESARIKAKKYHGTLNIIAGALIGMVLLWLLLVLTLLYFLIRAFV